MIAFQILKNIKTEVSFNRIKALQHSQERHVIAGFTRTINWLILTFFHWCKCKKILETQCVLFIKIKLRLIILEGIKN